MILLSILTVYIFHAKNIKRYVGTTMLKANVHPVELSANKLAEKMKLVNIIPRVLKTAPNESLDIIYINKRVQNLFPGLLLSPNEFKREPQIKWKVEPQTYYTLILIDPFLLTRQMPEGYVKGFSWLYWLVVNIPGDQINEGKILSKYETTVPKNALRPTDEIIRGLHALVFLLYKQSSGKCIQSESLYDESDSRLKFDLDEFTEKSNLGDPISANLFFDQTSRHISI